MSTTQEAERPTDQEILDYERKLKEEMTGSQPLVGDLSPDLSTLQAEYADGSPIFLRKIQSLSQTHPRMRSIKKDGNCFYRAFCFGFCDAYIRMMGSEDGRRWCRKAMEMVEGTRSLLEKAGYDPIVSEDFYEPFKDALAVGEPNAEGLPGASYEVAVGKLVEMFRTENRDLYEAFILDSYPSLDAFIASQVEPMNIESDQIHIVAMSNALKVSVKVADLDISDTDLNFHEISPMEPLEGVDEKDQPVITLLYRPGHYDLVYK
ncbi:hypothetical protein HDU97_001791 [Phlyctochytrium planicorne]|nr:hypothetical protein HDU97_001791 [Phlyctochytrium planicorne]